MMNTKSKSKLHGVSHFVAAILLFLLAAPLPAQDITIDDASVNEDGGALFLTFTVRLSALPPSGSATVDFEFADGSAVATAPGVPGDFNGTPGTKALTALTSTITVPIVLESVQELAETFTITLSNPVPAAVTLADATATGTIEESDIPVLGWDPGSTDAGAMVFLPPVPALQPPTPAGGHYFVRIHPLAPASGGWRTKLTFPSGEAGLYMSQGVLPEADGSAQFSSTRTGADGWVLRPDQFTPGDAWYIRVEASAATPWTLVSGEIFVTPLGSLPFTDANFNGTYDIGEASSACLIPPGMGVIGPEGMRFYSATIPAGTPAWSLSLGADPRAIAVQKNTVPFHDGPAYYIHRQANHMLLVPDFLGGNQESANLSVVGDPGDLIALDSRIQQVTTLAFGAPATVPALVAGSPYRVFRVTVPANTIAWETLTTAVGGNPNVALRRDQVPSEWFNDAVSEAPGGATDSITLVPPFLTDGTWYITVYGDSPYTFSLQQGPPVIPTIPYLGATVNPAPLKAGGVHFVVSNIAAQNGTLGWELALSDQVPGTEIALRRNAVPGRWQSRNGYAGPLGPPGGPVDYASDSGLLQRPGHQADVWYVGVFLPQVALDTFTLTRTEIVPLPVAWNAGTAALGAIPPQVWRFFQFDVPPLPAGSGWDIRITGDTMGAAGLGIRRDRLPETISPVAYGTGSNSATWPSGALWGSISDWTGRSTDPGLPTRYFKTLVSAAGRPLEPGRYYAGVFNDSTTTAADGTLQSRGIGTGNVTAGVPFTQQVAPLAFAGGAAAVAALAPREARYFHVTVPAGMPNWLVTLAPTTGEMMLLIRNGAIPDLGGWEGGDATENVNGAGQVNMQKAGPERFLMLPPNGAATIPAGEYFLAVVSEGDFPPDDATTGTGPCDGTLTSVGPITPTALPSWVVPASISLPLTLAAGEHRLLTFTAPASLTHFTAELTGVTGQPQLTVIPGTAFPDPDPTSAAFTYGQNGGSFGPGLRWDDRLLTIAQPAAGAWRMIVSATKAGPVTATITLTKGTIAPLIFNGGTATVVAQPPETWRYFMVTVPVTASGWDVRVRSITAGQPILVVRRDLLPDTLESTLDYPSYRTLWPSGLAWQGMSDWTGRQNDPGGPVPYANRLICGLGQPLQIGNYIVAVYNPSATEAADYVVESRGIGAGMVLPITPLGFSGPTATQVITGVPAREVRYFSVPILAGTPRWEFTLAATTGDWTVAIRNGTVPDFLARVDGDLSPPAPSGDAEVLLHKLGPERFLILPADGALTITPGNYTIAAMSHGADMANDFTTGPNPASATLTSLGVPPVTALGLAGGVPLVSPHTLAPGQYRLFNFNVPVGTTSMEVRIDARVEEQFLAIMPGAELPDLDISGGSAYSYGQDGGQEDPAREDDLQIITINTPAPGLWSGIVGAHSLNTLPATGNLTIITTGVAAVPFDGGIASVAAQAPGSWNYFSVTVPAGADGWDVRLRNIVGGAPQMVIRKGALPVLTFAGVNDSSTSWPDGEVMHGTVDWTRRPDDANGVPRYFARRVTGMGRPLSPGDYFVGVYNDPAAAPTSYLVESRGIGAGLTFPVTSLARAGGAAAISALQPGEARYFSVDIPAGVPSWRLVLTPTTGEMLMAVRRGTVPGFEATFSGDAGGPSSDSGYDLQLQMQKDGPERYLMLPPDGMTTLVPGKYFIAVVSEGVNPTASANGPGPVSGTLVSTSPQGIVGLGAVGGAPTVLPVSLFAGESQLLAFTVPAGAGLLEIRLDDRAGDPVICEIPGTLFPAAGLDGGSLLEYGTDGGSWAAGREDARSIITSRNPPAGAHRLRLTSSYLTDSTASLSLRTLNFAPLSFDATLNGPGLVNTAAMTLLDGQRALFFVDVPLTVSGEVVAAWELSLNETLGNARMRIFRTWGDESDSVTIAGNTAVLTTPWLERCRRYFIEVEGDGLTEVTLTSTAVRPFLPPFTMPVAFNTIIANTGEQDIGEDAWHFYAIDVPADNQGLLRTALEAVSGNPDLYLREDGVPSPDHGPAGLGSTYDRSMLEASGSEYGNWVPLDGRTQPVRLRPGRWWAAVRATGGSNARYRLILTTGTVTEVPSLATVAALAAQNLLDRDWRYYRFTVPPDAPLFWSQTFSQQLGDVVMYLRDTVPPGSTRYANHDFASAASDDKNAATWPANGNDAPGTYLRNCPPLRPGTTYFVGFRATTDSTFTFSSDRSIPTIGIDSLLDFYAGVLTLPANLAPGASVIRRVVVPPFVGRWRHACSGQPEELVVTIEQGTRPPATGFPHYQAVGPDSTLDQELSAAFWPWQPGRTYWVRVTNTGAVPAGLGFKLNMNGVDNAALVDVDGDLMPDAWEILHWGNIAALPGADADGDGEENLSEFAFGTNPTLAASFPSTVSGFTPPPMPRLTITFCVPGIPPAYVRYTVEVSNDLVTWMPLATHAPGTPWTEWPGAGQVSAPTPGPNGTVCLTAADCEPAAAHPVRFLRVTAGP
jgi:hypothetical protein